jgi:hypothetical protein
MSTAIKNSRTLVTAGTTNTSGSTARGSVDLRTALGGILTFKITNGATGPTIQCTANVLIAHNTGATPTLASAGSDWKTIFSVGNGSGNNTVGEWSYEVSAGVMHLEVEFTGNTAQTVTVEAYFSEITSIG